MRRPRAFPRGTPVQGPANLRLHETRIRPPRLQTDRRLRRGQRRDADRRAGLRAERDVGCGAAAKSSCKHAGRRIRGTGKLYGPESLADAGAAVSHQGGGGAGR